MFHSKSGPGLLTSESLCNGCDFWCQHSDNLLLSCGFHHKPATKACYLVALYSAQFHYWEACGYQNRWIFSFQFHRVLCSFCSESSLTVNVNPVIRYCSAVDFTTLLTSHKPATKDTRVKTSTHWLLYIDFCSWLCRGMLVLWQREASIKLCRGRLD